MLRVLALSIQPPKGVVCISREPACARPDYPAFWPQAPGREEDPLDSTQQGAGAAYAPLSVISTPVLVIPTIPSAWDRSHWALEQVAHARGHDDPPPSPMPRSSGATPGRGKCRCRNEHPVFDPGRARNHRRRTFSQIS